MGGRVALVFGIIGSASAAVADSAGVIAKPPGVDAGVAAIARGVYAVGTRFSGPPGTRCQIDRGEPAIDAIVTTPGPAVVRCDAATHFEIPVIVAPVRVDWAPVPLLPNTTTTIHIAVVSVAPIGEHLELHPLGPVTFGAIRRTAYGIDVPITIGDPQLTSGPGGPEPGAIVLAGSTELGRLEFPISERKATALVSRSAWFALELGGQVGAWFPPSGGHASALGNPRSDNDTLTSGPFAGGRIGVFPTRRVGLELEGSIAIAGFAHQIGTATVAITRAQLAWRMVDEDRFGLRLVAGADLLGVLTETATSTRDAEGGVHYGVAFTIETRRDLWLRLGADHLITAARDGGYAHNASVQLGVLTRLGRRDRWW